MRGVEKKWREAWGRHGGREKVSRGLGVILQIWRLGGHFCRDHGASAPPPSLYAELYKQPFLGLFSADLNYWDQISRDFGLFSRFFFSLDFFSSEIFFLWVFCLRYYWQPQRKKSPGILIINVKAWTKLSWKILLFFQVSCFI